MLKAFFYIVWVDVRSFKNRWKKVISTYIVHGIFVIPLIFLVSWILGHIFAKISSEPFFRELVHLLFIFLGILWGFLVFTTNLSSLNYYHLVKFPKYPFTFRQVFIAASIRALGDRWLLFFGPIMACIIIGMDIAGPIKILIAISGCLIFAYIIITYCQSLRAAIDIFGHSNMWGWVVKLLLGCIGFSIVLLLIVSSIDMEWLEKYASFNPSLLVAYLPTGLLCELFWSLKSGEISKAIYDLLGMIGFLAVGVVVGYEVTYQHIFNGGARKSNALRGDQNKVSLLEFLCNQVGKVEALQKCAPIITLELCYLIRSKKSRFFIVLGLIVVLSSFPGLKTLYEWHPYLIFLFPYGFTSFRPSATTLNKYGQGIITYYLIPVSAYQAIIGKNLAFFVLQCGILLLCIIYPLFLLWSDADIFLILSFLSLQISSIIYFITIGNFISLLYPYADVFAFSRFNSRDASPQASRIMMIEAVGYFVVLGLIVGVFYFLLQSSIWMFSFCLLLLILGIALYILLLPKASQLHERQKERIINTFLREGAIA